MNKNFNRFKICNVERCPLRYRLPKITNGQLTYSYICTDTNECYKLCRKRFKKNQLPQIEKEANKQMSWYKTAQIIAAKIEVL